MNILISACLLGENVRYDASNNKIDSTLFESVLSSHTLFSFCPEVEGGLLTPRNPAEILNNKVFTNQNDDVTSAFELGAQKALDLCQKENIQVALLKAKSPSCGNEYIYDGTFSKQLISGMGITAKLLSQNGIKVFNEEQLELFINYLKETVG